jgi:O-methyltransferase
MAQKPELLYLNLMKKALSFTLWPEPPTPISAFNYTRSSVTKALVSTVSKVLDKAHLKIVQDQQPSYDQRASGQVWPGYADTMIGLKRLDNLQRCIESILEDSIEGDLIETGVWRGGACIFMRAVLAAYNVTDRRVYVADSFEGLPKPDAKKYPADKGDNLHSHSPYLAISQEDVAKNFKRYDLLDDQVVFLKGWFKDSLPAANIDKLAVLRLDGDMYESTMDALENLYSKLSPGGYCIIDDYALEPCKLAVTEFRKKNKICSDIEDIDGCAVFWRKAEN